MWLVSGVNGLPHRVPDDEGAIAPLVARGFEVTDIPGDMPAADDEDFAAALDAWRASKEPAEVEESAEAEEPVEILDTTDQAAVGHETEEGKVNG